MANEPTVKLAANAMTTLEDTMERLGIPPEAADTAVKNNIIRLINSASAWIETITGRKFGKATGTLPPALRSLCSLSTPYGRLSTSGTPSTA